MTRWINHIIRYCEEHVSNAPLVVFRVLFGLMMLAATIRFWINGWIEELYINPKYHFTYHGFEWIKPLGDPGMYVLYAAIGIAALFIALGFLYRISTVVFFLTFTYSELIDVTNYLNHYYFVSLVSFLLIFLPAHRRFSIDTKLGLASWTNMAPRWARGSIMLQLGMVYLFAGIAKINTDWLIEGQPLGIWLKPKHEIPLVGNLFLENWFILLMAWFGMIYDICIPFLLLYKRTRLPAYALVMAFHVLTYILFPIGMFPLIMILSTLIFFPSRYHEKLLNRWENKEPSPSFQKRAIVPYLLIAFFVLQTLMPFRYLLHSGDLFWTEQGFRFSWRVMLMEKYGTGTFYVGDPDYPGRLPVCNSDYLSPQQEKMVFSQPDLILQYAQIIQEDFRNRIVIEGGDTLLIDEPEVYADIVVTLNGRGHQQFTDPNMDLTRIENGFYNRSWLMPQKE